jgi:hypothetical protein
MSDFRLDDQGFLFAIIFRPALEFKQLDYEADHSPEDKKVCCYTTLFPYFFTIWCLIIINQLHLVNFLYHIHFKVLLFNVHEKKTPKVTNILSFALKLCS